MRMNFIRGKWIAALCLCLCALSVGAQGIRFTEGTWDEVLKQAGEKGCPVFVDIYTTWCGPCKKIGPYIEELAEEYKDSAIIGKCDVEENDDLAMRFGIRNVPTVLYIKNGEVIEKQVGAATKDVFENKLKEIL